MVYAQTMPAWPTKPIILVVTYPPGGGADTMARLLAPKLGEALGQPVVIENKPGASGQIGALDTGDCTSPDQAGRRLTRAGSRGSAQ